MALQLSLQEALAGALSPFPATGKMGMERWRHPLQLTGRTPF